MERTLTQVRIKKNMILLLSLTQLGKWKMAAFWPQ